MKTIPEVTRLPGGEVCWQHTFDRFRVKVFVPKGHELSDLINFGFLAPYLLVFEEAEMTLAEAAVFALEKGFAEAAARYSGSVVFVYPTAEGGWAEADENLFIDLIAESRIQQYYQDGMILSRDRFTKEWGDLFIRGAIFRTFLYGYGASADYIANHLLKTINGLYLWGPGEITPTAANVVQYANIVRDQAQLRSLAVAAGEIRETVFEGVGTAAEIMESAEKKIFAIRQGNTGDSLQHIGTVLVNVFDRLDELSRSDNAFPGLSTGLLDLDKKINGLNKSDLILIAARPGMGKTSIALNIALAAAKKYDKTVAFFSLEMSREQLAMRLVSNESFVDNQKLVTGKLTQQRRILHRSTMFITAQNRSQIKTEPVHTVFCHPITKAFHDKLRHYRMITVHNVTTTTKVVIKTFRCQHIVNIIIDSLE